MNNFSVNKKSILLVSLCDNKNFGNRLQTIALKHIIEGLDYNVVCSLSYKYDLKNTLKIIIKGILGLIGIKKYKKNYLLWYRLITLRESSHKYLQPCTKMIFRYKPGNKVHPLDYEKAVCGSDQIWHRWSEYPDELPYFYLNFMPKEKRISYAASFGFEKFPERDLQTHISGLNGMRDISCRERAGCDLVEQATGKQGMLVLDPTLCVEKEFWMGLEKKPDYFFQDHYLLLFMLGRSSSYMSAIKSYADAHQLQIIDLMDLYKKDVWETSVENFLWLIHHADYVCTDSFHCLCFCITYEKDFTIFKRVGTGFENMYDRIETLLDTTKLDPHQYNGSEIKNVVSDFEYSNRMIQNGKRISIDWLKSALDK